MNMGASRAEFIHVNADDAFMKRVGSGEHERAANSESGFRE
jgi:hypothetical protein